MSMLTDKEQLTLIVQDNEYAQLAKLGDTAGIADAIARRSGEFAFGFTSNGARLRAGDFLTNFGWSRGTEILALMRASNGPAAELLRVLDSPEGLNASDESAEAFWQSIVPSILTQEESQQLMNLGRTSVVLDRQAVAELLLQLWPSGKHDPTKVDDAAQASDISTVIKAQADAAKVAEQAALKDERIELEASLNG